MTETAPAIAPGTTAAAPIAPGQAPPAAPEAAIALEAAFRAIHLERMQGMPFVNAALSVEAVGFAPWRDHWLGALITPWFMSLVLLPRVAGKWLRLGVGDSWSYAFPAGVFDFIGGFDARVGEFQSCSLFSPMFEFPDQETARITAVAALQALFDARNLERTDVGPLPSPVPQPHDADAPGVKGGTPEASGDAPAREPASPHEPVAPAEASAPGESSPVDARIAATVPLSRRAVLRGEFLAPRREPRR